MYQPEKLKARRKELGMTQKEISDQLGITFQAYSAWESGNNRLSPENLKRIAAHYRVNAFMPIQSFDIAIKFVF